MRAGCWILSLVFLAVCATPSLADKKLIAAVLTSDINRYRDAHRAFVRTLAQKGYDPGTVDIILQTPNPDPISWANTVRKFEALGADIIVTYGAPITLTAMRETHGHSNYLRRCLRPCRDRHSKKHDHDREKRRWCQF